ncbi:MAG TPA: FAD-dependent oxidoreductase [Solirubrobacteraceae bacterium]|nr:FAD-dependent oxidoreductase [Solirubrobacteraceae bacterium]
MTGDVAIIGAGIVGCSTAYFLAREGVRVTVHDRAGIAAGASGRNNGLVEHPYDAPSAALFHESVELLQDLLGPAMPADPVGALLLCDGEAAARELAEHYARFPELAPELLHPNQVRAREPMLADGLWGCRLATGYPISPWEATVAVAERARAAGARFALEAPVSLDVLRDRAEQVVVAAGAASAELLAGFVAPETVRPLWGVIVLVEMAQSPRQPIIEGTVTRGLTTGTITDESPFTLLPSPSWLAVGSTMLEGAEPSGEEWAPRLLARGARFVPALARAATRGTLVCARPKSFDNRPILGRVPSEDHLWLASGHGGRGMSLGVASGRMIAEAVLTGDERGIPAELRARRLVGAPQPHGVTR